VARSAELLRRCILLLLIARGLLRGGATETEEVGERIDSLGGRGRLLCRIGEIGDAIWIGVEDIDERVSRILLTRDPTNVVL